MVYYINSLDEAGSEMTNKKATNYEEFEAELLKKPQIRKEYEALKPKYDMIRSIIERRSQLHISQTQLAEMIGTRQPAISRLEKGDYNTTLSTFFKVANALNLDISLKAQRKTRRISNKVHA
jgi:DNA-binding XRE family transcriptional regulator